MSETDESVTDESTESTTEEETTEESTSTEETEQPDPNAGAKKALVTERTARKAAENELKTLKQQLADKDKPAEEQAIAERIREATAEVTSKANQRLIAAEIRAAATGKVKNPALALKLIDMSGIDVSDDGEVDSDALEAAITTLLADYPELAADGSKFGGAADQGAKNKSSTVTQWTEQDLTRADAAGDSDGIAKAKAEGKLDNILGIKR